MTLSATQAGLITGGISLLTVVGVAFVSPLLASVAAVSMVATVGLAALNILGIIAALSVVASVVVLKHISNQYREMKASEFFQGFPWAFLIVTVVVAIALGIAFLTGGAGSSLVVVV